MSVELAKAREYERQGEERIDPKERPGFHFSPRIGWLNDPNGFSYYKGQYHLFYQYFPYSPHWDSMHWGHSVTKDFVKWDYLPAALAPDTDVDKDGCFSGSAVTLDDGKQLLMYTGLVYDKGNVDIVGIQTQNLALGDGTEYEKYGENPVITCKDVSESISPYDFRDPKLWRSEDGIFHMVLAARSKEGFTQIPMFVSEDGFKWEADKILLENHDEIGRMWECPDYFNLGGKDVLLISAMDMVAKGKEFHSGNNCIYFVKEKEELFAFDDEHVHTLDYGIDFYAAQTLEAPDGRRILIAWMQNPDTTSLRTVHHPVFGQMTIPRELTIQNGKLYQNPVKELKAYRRDEIIVENISLEDGEITIPGVRGRIVDLEVEIASAGNDLYQQFAVRFAAKDDMYTEFRFRPKEDLISVDRKYSGQRRAIIRHRDAEFHNHNGNLNFRLLIDRYSGEVFVNNGEKVMSLTIETDLDAEEIRFSAIGKLKINVKKYNLEV